MTPEQAKLLFELQAALDAAKLYILQTEAILKIFKTLVNQKENEYA